MRWIFITATTLWLFVLAATGAWANELSLLLDQVAALNISRGGYVLGKPLTDEQRLTARQHSETIDNPNLFKFKDGRLYIVALKETDRVIILYEDHVGATRKQIQDFVGNLFLDYGKPTVFSHDKVIYWAWNQEGTISSEAFKAAKKKRDPPTILATVKLNSSVPIMDAKGDKSSGNIYYIVSSDPALKLIKE